MQEQSTASTTYGNLYKDKLEQTLTQYKNQYAESIRLYEPPAGPVPTDIIQLLKLEKQLDKNLQVVRGVTLQPVKFDVAGSVVGYYEALNQTAVTRRQQIRDEAAAEKSRRQAEHSAEIESVKQHNASLSVPYKEKHASLLQYKDKLKYVFEHYDISPMDIAISDNLTVKEFETLIDTSVAVCEKYSVQKESNIVSRILKPLQGERNLQFTAGYSLILLVGLYLLLPIAAIPLFVVMTKSVHNLYKDIEALRIANALMTQIDYDRFVDKNDIQEASELDLTDVDADEDKKLSEVKDYTKELEDAKSALASEDAYVKKRMLDAQMEVKSSLGTMADKITTKLTEVKAAISQYMSEYKPFPTVQNDSVVLNHNFVLGKVEGKIDVREEVPLKNIVFDTTNMQFALDSVKLYLANMLLGVRVKQLTVEVYDPINMCGEFTEFFKPETAPYIKPNKMELSELLKKYKGLLQQNIIELDKQDIDTFNKIAEEKEIVPKAYQLLILVSKFDNLKKDKEAEEFKELMRYSARSGVLIWIMDTDQYPDTVRVSENIALRADALKYTRELGKQAVSTYITALSKYKDRGIDYVTKLGNVFIPEEKWWTWDSIKGVYMPWGLENGDPTRGITSWPMLGDANVHALLGGATGAGKSAEINQHLVSMITMYPPSELQLVYIDFKNVEAAKFTRGHVKSTDSWMTAEQEKELRERKEFYTRLSRIPHLKIISGTTDGEYALSVFEFLLGEMQRRQEIINKFGVTKIQEMREQILAGYNKEHNGDPKKGTWAEMRKDWDWYKVNVYDKYGDLPRLVVIFDEFQVMFNTEFVEQRIIDTINGKITAITKLARAMACHFWFTSQSMKGTMSKDTIGNFSLRGALRCASDVSDELLGNNAAGTITAKFGFMYTNDSAGQSKEANKFWRVPFLDEKKLPNYIDKLNDMLDEFNEKHLMAEFYDEKILVPSRELESWYENYPDAFSDPNTFILGERAAYSTNKAPSSVTLMDDGGENILIAAFERNDMMNLALTIIDNLKHKDVTLIINCQDKDTYTLMAVDELVDEAFLEISKPEQDIEQLVEAFEGMIEARKNAPPPYKPVYAVLIQWERANGVSVGNNYRLQERFKAVMRDAPTLGLHFVFVCKEKLELQRMVPAACNHRIGAFLPKDAMFFIETPKVEKLPDANKDAGLFAIYEYGSNTTKFRIYQHEFTRKLKAREVVIQ